MLSGVWYFLPGCGVSLGTAELVGGKKMLSGVSRLLRVIVSLVWLNSGQIRWVNEWCKALRRHSLDPIQHPIAKKSLALYIPALIVSLSVVLNNSRRDLPLLVVCMLVALFSSTDGGVLQEEEEHLGVIWGSAIMTIYSNTWSNRMHRPNTLVLLPTYPMQASGSIEYLGLLRIMEGHSSIGVDNVLDMFMIMLPVTTGIFLGNTLDPLHQRIFWLVHQ